MTCLSSAGSALAARKWFRAYLRIFLSMSSSASPGSRSLHISSSFGTDRTCLRREKNVSALPITFNFEAYWFAIATTC